MGSAYDLLNTKNKKEQYEMQYNYINLKNLQYYNGKIELTRTLKNCDDLALFDQEVIQIIIDYKWNVHTRKYFLILFYLYTSFVIAYVIDIETLNLIEEGDEVGYRIKNNTFIFVKSYCFII